MITQRLTPHQRETNYPVKIYISFKSNFAQICTVLKIINDLIFIEIFVSFGSNNVFTPSEVLYKRITHTVILSSLED